MKRRLLQVVYRGATGKTYRGHLAPYAIVMYRNGLYVVGHRVDAPEAASSLIDRKDPPFVYSVERFLEAEALKKATFSPPATFRLRERLSGAFGIMTGRQQHTVVVDFAPQVRHLVEARTFHATQRVEPLTGGGLRLTLQVSELTEVVPWILAFGPTAVVVQPPELLESVRSSLQAALAAYAEPGR